MSKLTKQNVGGIDYTTVGCMLTGSCATPAADFIKTVALSDGDIISDGMTVACTFTYANAAGNSPAGQTVYSSDQITYYEDVGLTVPVTLAPEGCYTITYTGTGNAYTYVCYPVIQIGSVSAPVKDSQGNILSGGIWQDGEKLMLTYTDSSFMPTGSGGGNADIEFFESKDDLDDALPNIPDNTYAACPDTGEELSDPVNVVEEGNLNAVTSNAVAQLLKKYEFSGTTNSIGELEITTKLPINAVPVCAMSKVGGNIQMIPVVYDISGTKTCYIQVWNDSTNAVRKNFACQGILYYLLDYSLQ